MTVAGRASIGLLGKHPGYGDFLRAGLSDGVADGLTGWI
ncbi:type VI secretion system-associated protein TagF, partial [Rhodovulum sulfidophilum]|nr:type VI secretion system-associated protein TagF [Rhodovulum sulfidophilum]